MSGIIAIMNSKARVSVPEKYLFGFLSLLQFPSRCQFRRPVFLSIHDEVYDLLSLFYSLWVFHTSVSCWSFEEIWMIANLLRSPGLFLVFWLISSILLSGWSWFYHWFSIPLVTSPNPWGPFQEHKLQFVLPSPTCSVAL